MLKRRLIIIPTKPHCMQFIDLNPLKIGTANEAAYNRNPNTPCVSNISKKPLWALKDKSQLPKNIFSLKILYAYSHNLNLKKSELEFEKKALWVKLLIPKRIIGIPTKTIMPALTANLPFLI